MRVEEKPHEMLSFVLNNSRISKLGPIDSLILEFYQYNINLKQKDYLSALASSKTSTFSEVLYAKPIKFFLINYPNRLTIKGGDSYEIKVPVKSLIDAVNNSGNADNKLQVKEQFQIFVTGFRKGKMIYHLPSSFFKIE
jgi:hypothetical protein